MPNRVHAWTGEGGQVNYTTGTPVVLCVVENVTCEFPKTRINFDCFAEVGFPGVNAICTFTIYQGTDETGIAIGTVVCGVDNAVDQDDIIFRFSVTSDELEVACATFALVLVESVQGSGGTVGRSSVTATIA